MIRKIIGVMSVLFCCVGLNGCAGQTEYDPVSMDPPIPDPTYPPVFHELLMPSHDLLLSGFMLGANGKGPHPTIVLLHGFPGNEKNLDLAQSLRRAGYNVLFFHYRGAWGSQGDYTVGQQSDDVAAVLEYVRENADTLRADTNQLSIIGHSLGGFTALRATAQDKEINCVVALAAANFSEFINLSEEEKQGFAAYADKLFMLNNYSGAKVFSELYANLDDFDVRNLAASFDGRSVLLITGDQDTAVPVEVQSRIVEAYKKVPGIDLTAEVIPGDHAFSVSRIRLQRRIIEWMNQHCR